MGYRVLVPVDRDETRAVHQANYVTGLSDVAETVEATVLYVVSPDELNRADEVAFTDVEAAVEAAAHLEDEGVTVSRVVDGGGVSEQIVHIADELDVDEIAIGGRKRSGVAKVLLGSTAQDVMLSADHPVTVVGEDVTVGDEFRRILIPVDRSETRARHQADYVAGLPDASETVEATVLHVFPHQDYRGAPPHEFDEVEAAVEAAERLEAEGIHVERVAIGGEVARTILEHADDLRAESIVVGGRKRSGLQKILLGSITQDLVLSTERPVTVTG